ncbi:MAG TPA: hypothetical protein VJY39_16160 [Acidisphaera sp.]|nr:hypothetical protein [Acidisphaera sp.]
MAAAQEALYTARTAADEAERVAPLRQAFDERAKALVTKAGTNVALTGKITAVVNAAKPVADKFDFDGAGRVLDSADAAFEGEKVKRLASGTDEAALMTAVKEMMKKSGGSGIAPGVKDGPKQLDEIVTSLSATTTKPEVFSKTCKERFGIELSAKGETGAFSDVKDAKTLQNLYKTLAMTPDQVKDNPSLKKVVRTKVGSAGGAYDASENATEMLGRPADPNYKQQFGSKLLNSGGTNQLPAPLSNDYKPANEDALDYFEFANVHETGHSVDDRLGFMSGRLGQAAFGGWALYGGDLGPIADAVAGKYGAAFADQLKPFVIDLMTGNQPDNPKATDPTKQAALNDACQKIRDDWFKNANVKGECWWDQGKCTKITIGDKIYHEAYAGTWVSYTAAERSKGITGYQFRAPGEWFAELFAAYHHKKLKPSHPAVAWLKDL